MEDVRDMVKVGKYPSSIAGPDEEGGLGGNVKRLLWWGGGSLDLACVR